MKREQIIEILRQKLYIDEEYDTRKDKNQYWIEGIDECADAIIALPLDVPEWYAVESKADDIADCMSKRGFERGEWLGFKEGAGWAITEIIKRNR